MYFGSNKSEVIEKGKQTFSINHKKKIHTVDHLIEEIQSKIPECFDKNVYYKMKTFLKYVQTQQKD